MGKPLKLVFQRNEITMKARVKATGKLLEKVIPIMSVDSKVVMFHEYGTENEYYYYEDLDFSNTIDWQQVRIQASIAAMSIVADDGYNVRNEQHLIAKYAVEIADALIEELKKGGQND